MTPNLPLLDMPLGQLVAERREPSGAGASVSLLANANSPECSRTSATNAAPEASAFQKLQQLSRQIREMETAGRPDEERIASGCPAMDRYLQGGGYARGSMLELLRCHSGSGITSIALMIARQAIVEGKYLVLVDPQRQFYPPALKSLGIPMERVIALQPSNHADAIWGLAQVLRCAAVGAVIAEVGTLEDRVARKLQLAAEQGGGLGVFIRDARAARAQPSWADVQWLVRSTTSTTTQEYNAVQYQDTRWFQLELARCSGGRTGARITVGVNAHGQWVANTPSTQGARHEHASALHLAAQLAQPTRRSREIAG
jgi:protein ImuA